MSYDAWKTRSPNDGIPDLARCHRCNAPCGGTEDHYDGEIVCEQCLKPRWEIGKNGWDASDEITREDI